MLDQVEFILYSMENIFTNFSTITNQRKNMSFNKLLKGFSKFQYVFQVKKKKSLRKGIRGSFSLFF